MVDGTVSMEEDDATYDKKKRGRGRQEEETDMGEQTFQRLQHLEALFGCSASIKSFRT